jgi:hypothetical protein
MFASRILRLPSVFWTTLLIALLILVLGVIRVHSQGPQKTIRPATYDTATETKIKGTVEEIRPAASSSKTAAIDLMLKGESATVEVSLCPKPFLDDLGVTFAKGDSLEITGSKVKRGDLEQVLAREVVKGNDTVVLRDKTGKPVWWMNVGRAMADLTQSELKAICRVLAHFLDGGWTEIMESRDEEDSEMFFDNIESAHEKLSRASRSKAAWTRLSPPVPLPLRMILLAVYSQ